jgi:tetratricopeptide (TPR) repeat protein
MDGGGINNMITKHQRAIQQIEAKFQAGKYAEAMDLCNYAIALNPKDITAYRAKARLLQIEKDFAESEKYYDAAEKRGKLTADDLINRGITKGEQQKYDEAVKDFTEALKLKPDYPQAYIQRGASHWEMRRWDLAKQDFLKANELSPNDDNAGWILGLLSLQQNDFETGWPLYEKRWGSNRFKSRRLVTQKPQWSLESEHKSVLVWGEQGIGDMIIYGSLLPSIRKRADYVTAMVDPRLISLFSRSMPDINFMSSIDQVKSDLHTSQIPFASIGRSFIKSLDDIEYYAAREYLKADPELVEKYRKELNLDPNKLTVGLSWVSVAPKIGPHKSIDLGQLLPVMNLDVNLINLQYGSDKKAVDYFNQKNGVNIQTSSVNLHTDFEGLAALCKLCDVIVAISSSTVHLAGALGAPVMLMDANKLWYWGNVRGDRSVWYPSVRIFPRENMIAPWNSVVEKVTQAVGEMIRDRQSKPSGVVEE